MKWQNNKQLEHNIFQEVLDYTHFSIEQELSIEASGSCHLNTTHFKQYLLQYNINLIIIHISNWVQYIVKTSWEEMQIAGQGAEDHEGELC